MVLCQDAHAHVLCIALSIRESPNNQKKTGKKNSMQEYTVREKQRSVGVREGGST